MSQEERANRFKSLHIKGNPVILFNIWDAGSALAVQNAGAKALATGSWSVAAAQGYGDGEKVPLSTLSQIAQRIVDTTDLPLSVDFEGGYDISPELAAKNVSMIMKAGAIGINFEDQIVGGEGIHSVADQCARIKAIRKISDTMKIPLFINARTDYFLKEKDTSEHKALMCEVKERADAYAEAGASGYFVPGLAEGQLIADICDYSKLPVNIMMKEGVPAASELAKLGVSRISHGPFPYMASMQTLTESAKSQIKK
ncbi:MAG: isocitrate lyase/phosphoenolpyruvate mutase family protein [Emcibacteraceae bacterium]|nr:isocitrate lyase/phosphoenolpyruvate mutase family protein [Emcibacteraceae bacterium]